MYLWHDGTIKREEEVRISPLDHGYVYGMGVFETFRTYNGHPFLFDDHIERLRMSCIALGIQLAYDRKRCGKRSRIYMKHMRRTIYTFG
ncbi:aminotransferase class IV [Exiguobacterium sp. SL14]|nr:aminotransferase class IV [Exiguobacterium sp. SL14]MCY1692668.1 aminotransferase class IV [Exiguobacterium sp. SL14]